MIFLTRFDKSLNKDIYLNVLGVAILRSKIFFFFIEEKEIFL